jgi:hypothetical protein
LPEREHLLLPTGKIPGTLIPAFAQDREVLEDLLGGLSDVVGVLPEHPCGQTKILFDGESGEDATGAGHEDDAFLGRFVGTGFRDVRGAGE